MNDVVLVTGVGGYRQGHCRALCCLRILSCHARAPRNGNDIAQATPNTHPFVCDVSDADRLSAVLEEIRQQLGAPKIAIHNAVECERRTYLVVDAEKMRAAFEIMALLSLAKQLVPDMQASGRGALIATGNTSAGVRRASLDSRDQGSAAHIARKYRAGGWPKGRAWQLTSP